MNIVDYIIIIFILFGFISGFKRGIIKQGVLTFGTILVVFLAFMFKNSLSMVLYEKFSFFTVGLLENYSMLNILLYELISFFILLSIFSLIFAIIVKISGIIEKFLRATIILALPSKILGGILGIIEFYVITFIVLLIITMPIFEVSKVDVIRESKVKDRILNNSLLMSKVSNGLIDSVYEINDLINDKKKLGTKEFNCKSLNIFVKNKIVSKESINYLKENNKISNSCKIKINQ
ncbi:MAG: CvpA family protein [Bacilli bacterium]|nr:CvpA family protein [Bacilli bacterium]